MKLTNISRWWWYPWTKLEWVKQHQSFYMGWYNLYLLILLLWLMKVLKNYLCDFCYCIIIWYDISGTEISSPVSSNSMTPTATNGTVCVMMDRKIPICFYNTITLLLPFSFTRYRCSFLRCASDSNCRNYICGLLHIVINFISGSSCVCLWYQEMETCTWWETDQLQWMWGMPLYCIVVFNGLCNAFYSLCKLN